MSSKIGKDFKGELRCWFRNLNISWCPDGEVRVVGSPWDLKKVRRSHKKCQSQRETEIVSTLCHLTKTESSKRLSKGKYDHLLAIVTSWERQWIDQVAHYGPWAKSDPALISVNKVLLEHSHIFLFSLYILLSCFHTDGNLVATEPLWRIRPKIFTI